jgi:hypothetical protein
MSPAHLQERETHRARSLADALADVRVKLGELESVQRSMTAAGIEPRHVIRADSMEYLEYWFYIHHTGALWRLRHPGQSHHHAAVVQAKQRAWRLYDAGGF